MLGLGVRKTRTLRLRTSCRRKVIHRHRSSHPSEARYVLAAAGEQSFLVPLSSSCVVFQQMQPGQISSALICYCQITAISARSDPRSRDIGPGIRTA